MKKFLNTPERFVEDMLEGILAAHPRLGSAGDDPRCLVLRERTKGKVGIVTGGGSGHLPLFLGYVGQGMLDGCAVGGVFQSPSSDQILQVTRYVDQGAGVLYLYGNYSGDLLNFDMAAELADIEDIRVMTVVGNDDVASAAAGTEAKRRGVAGIFFLYKAAGAAAAEGMTLDEVAHVADKARQRTRTIGVALSPCIVPEIGHATFSVPEGDMEIGMGIHGEPGIRRGRLGSADEVADEMLDLILADQPLGAGDEVGVLVNGLGATPQEELYILYRRVAQRIDALGVRARHVWVGEYATAMEMAGASISIIKLDAELDRLLASSADTPFFGQQQR